MVHPPSTVAPEAGWEWRERIEARIIPLCAPMGLFHFPLLSRICSHLICPTGQGGRESQPGIGLGKKQPPSSLRHAGIIHLETMHWQ